MPMYAKFLLSLLLLGVLQQPVDPWTPQQLMEPADLAARIKNGTAPLLICVGPSGLITGSVETGPAHEAVHLDSLKRLLASVDRNREVVIYCGCCPFVHCPNVRPAFNLLLSMHFTHARLLDLAHNIKTDWLDHGYPVKEEGAHAK
jgi:thiosulfate/3-mercaptopyruvate sulfurtransferase